MSVFCLDTNFFIEAHRKTYPFDVAVGFWAKVAELAEQEKIYSIDKVKHEIFVHDDELKQWCEINLPDTFFRDSSSSLEMYERLITWINSRRGHYTPAAIEEFLAVGEADAWLVAHALQDSANRIIVTHEVSEPAIKRKVKIPECCDAHGVSFCNTITMFRTLGERF